MTKGRRDRSPGSRRSAVDELRDQSQLAPEGRPAKAFTGQRKRHSSGRSAGSGFAYVIVPAIVVIVLGAGFFWYTGSQQSTGNSGGNGQSSEVASLLSDVAWPVYVSRGPTSVKEAYQYAVLRPDVLKYMPCYCGCGQHNGHRSNEDCFIAGMNEGGRTIAFEQHGSTWDICTDIARDAKRSVNNGKTLTEIRTYIDKTYGGRGDATNTPLPPGV